VTSCDVEQQPTGQDEAMSRGDAVVAGVVSQTYPVGLIFFYYYN
jgi:hypothetical protein